MSIRRQIIDYSRGDNLRHFWHLYKLQKKIGSGLIHDILTFFLSRSAHRHGGYIGPDAVIDETLSLPHGLHGIFISRYAVIGKDCWMYQNVTIGEVNRKAPVIGDNVLIGAGAVVTTDIPDNCTVVSQPGRIIEP